MDAKKPKLTKKIEDTMACSAFAEAGEPCPIGAGKDKKGAAPSPKKNKAKKKSVVKSVEDTMACTAFAESSEPCPLDNGKKKKA